MSQTKIIKKRRVDDPGASWIMTFADLMTLLLTFFILLLSFSNIDAEKYKMIADSMAVSFGVSWIQGTPPPSVVFVEVPQLVPAPEEQAAIKEDGKEDQEKEPTVIPPTPTVSVNAYDPNVERLAENLIRQLENEIATNSLSVSYDDQRVMVRFSEEATFSSGSSELKEEMDPILTKIVDVLSQCEGDIVVSGYTDDRPITTGRFRSNWDLSAARAVSVVHQLTENTKINSERVMAAGHAESHAIVPNDSVENRAKNRRVELKIFNPDCVDAISW